MGRGSIYKIFSGIREHSNCKISLDDTGKMVCSDKKILVSNNFDSDLYARHSVK